MRYEDDEAVEVLCHSGHKYDERPDSFLWRGTLYDVESVVAEWREPRGHLFRVHTESNKRFDLCYDDEADRWTLKALV
jgi:hypothetical protein